jgi:hypothetical protein
MGSRIIWFLAGAALAASAACSASDSGQNAGGKPVVGLPPTAAGNLGMGTGGASGAVPNAAPAASSAPKPATATGGIGAPPPASSTGGVGAPPAGGGAAGAGAAGAGMMTPVAKTPHGTKTCLQPGNGNYTSPGPYQVGMMDVDLGMVDSGQGTGMFTIFYPMPLETACLHPIVAWGNGTGVTGSATYAFLNTNAASWGMVIAAAQDSNTGSGNFHKAGIDYLLKQNADPKSMFYQKLSTRAGVSGHSQGGIGASAGSAHPNVETAAIEGMQMVASAKVSVLVMTGTMDIVTNVEALVPMAKGPMFVANWEGGDHVTTETVAGFISGDKGTLQFQRLYAAWFRCMLADDGVACALFQGAPSSCGICKDTGWHALASNM